MNAKFDLSVPLSGLALERALASQSLPASGEIASDQMTRLSASCQRIDSPIAWEFFPDDQPPGPGHPRRRWWLEARATLACRCERCLEPVIVNLSVRRGFEFFESAALADARTEQATEEEERDPDAAMVDFLAPEDSASLMALLEDELLLELPLAPKHENCQAPLTQAPPVPEKANPFAGLKDLVSGPSKGKNTL